MYTEALDKDTRMWAMLCHLSALSQYIGVPFGHILGPLVIWLIKREEHPFINDQGREALNFQISMTIYGIIAALLIFILIGIPLLILLAIAHFVLIIIAGIKANNGERYRYPFTIRFLQ